MNQHKATNEEKDFIVAEMMEIFKEFFPKIKRVNFSFVVMGAEQLAISAKGKTIFLTCYLLLDAMRKPHYQRKAIAQEIATELGIK